MTVGFRRVMLQMQAVWASHQNKG